MRKRRKNLRKKNINIQKMISMMRKKKKMIMKKTGIWILIQIELIIRLKIIIYY